MQITVFGMSHVGALMAAQRQDEKPHLRIINLRTRPGLFDMKTKSLSLAAWDGPDPEVVALSLGGNLHNLISLMESPVPFALGDAVAGSVPPPDLQGPDPQTDAARRFVPHDMLWALLDRRLAPTRQQFRDFHARFARSRLVYLASPPPTRAGPVLSEEEMTGTTPRAMTRYLAFNANPPALRVAVYRMHERFYAALAAENGARVLAPPAAAVTAEGLLSDAFWDDDPTHGNAAYGRLVLDQIRQEAAL